MNKYQYTMSIEARTEKEAEAKMEALAILASRLNEKELGKLAHVIKHDPVKTALAKRYLGV
jgi:ribosomal protein L15E